MTAELRRPSILDAATPVFLRFGFRKASMDDIARAAGISRQALYSHFASKEALFTDVVLRILEATRTAASAALERLDAPVEERLLETFEAIHAYTIGSVGVEQMSELLETAAALVGPAFRDLEERVVANVATHLATSGVVATLEQESIFARELAEHLYYVSLGLKHGVATRAEYRAGMRVAVRLVCRQGTR